MGEGGEGPGGGAAARLPPGAGPPVSVRIYRASRDDLLTIQISERLFSHDLALPFKQKFADISEILARVDAYSSQASLSAPLSTATQ